MMKIKTVHSIILAGVCFVTALQAPVHAAEPGLYFGLDGGLNLTHDVDLDFSAGGFSLPGDAEFHTGFRFDMLGGYNLNEFFGVELESGFIYNTFSSLTIAGNELDDGDSFLGRVPLLANAIFRYENETAFTPYAGIGAGGALTILEIDEVETDTQFAFAWQAQLGVKYAFDERSSVGVGYKYFGTTSQEYEIEDVDLELEETHSHAFVVSVNFKF